MYVVLGAAVACFILLQLFLWVGKASFWDSSNYVYLVFGVGITRAAEYYFYNNPGLLDLNRLGSESTWEESLLVGISAGYFLYDIPLSLYLKEVWYMFLHHVLSLVIVGTTWYYNRCGFEVLICLWLGEFTCPCSFWMFLYAEKPEKMKTKRMVVNRICFFSFFLVLRFVIGPFFVYRLFMSRDTMLVIKIGCVMFYIVNFALLKNIFVEIIQIYNSFVSKKKQSRTFNN